MCGVYGWGVCEVCVCVWVGVCVTCVSVGVCEVCVCGGVWVGVV